MAEKTYLELSEDGGKSHKFYELTLDGTTVTVRFGRIGDNGQTQTGYAPAVMGQRQKRAVTRREIVSQKPTAGTSAAPVIWKFSAGSERAFGIFVDEARCWVGNEAGSIYSLDHDGKTLDQFRLPDGVKCIVADDQWLYAGCDDGKVYDLGGKTPRVAYEIADDVDIFWIDIKDGVLGISDASGNIAVFNHEDETQWKKKSTGSA